MLFNVTSYARAGLLGNPSDGYFGKTIAFSIANFPVDITIYESPEIKIKPGEVDENTFTNLDELLHTVQHYGYYGGIRLIKAVCKVFAIYCHENGIKLPKRNFTIRYTSTIPRLVGLGGSSAICTATFKALMKFYEISTQQIPMKIIPTLCWWAESDELGIHCGMQDRVIQVYEGLLFMDFEEKHFLAKDHGHYSWLPQEKLPNIYLAYDPNRAEFSGIYHRKLRTMFEEKQANIVAAMDEFASFAQRGAEAILASDHAELSRLIDANYDLRSRLFNISPGNAKMIACARAAGASAKFAGSGGAIVGTYTDNQMFQKLTTNLNAIGCTVICPRIAAAKNSANFPD